MVKVSIKVQNGASCFNVAVQAESIERAASIVGGTNPDNDVQVKFPISPDGFFVKVEPSKRTAA